MTLNRARYDRPASRPKASARRVAWRGGFRRFEQVIPGEKSGEEEGGKPEVGGAQEGEVAGDAW